jgi:hypothetical protein
MTTVVITQSNYIPWRGYFDQIRHADHFVFYDCVQFTRRDWRNRNRILTADGPRWLTIPVVSKGRYTQSVDETEISDPDWAAMHLKTLRHNYGRSRLFTEHGPLIEGLYGRASGMTMLSEVNATFTQDLARLLGLNATFHDSRDFNLKEGRSERLLGICKELGATEYLSGPAAQNYLDTELFARAGVRVRWMDYPAYRPYSQNGGVFEPGVSILDTLGHVPADEVFTVA